MTKIVVVEGHPDPSPDHLNRALADRYADAAIAAGHEVRRIRVGQLDFPLLRSSDDFALGQTPPQIHDAQRDIAWADHLAFFFPLWIGDMPSLMKAFLEQTFRPGFALDYGGKGRFPKRLLTGKSARIVVTMGMPGLAYRLIFGGHSIEAFAASLSLCGISPVRQTVVGGLGQTPNRRSRGWVRRMAALARGDGALERAPRAHPARALGAILLLGAGAYAAYVALTWVRFGERKRASSLLDAVMPEYDVRLHHAVTIHAPAAVAFDAMCHTDFERSPIVQALLRARAVILRAKPTTEKMPHALLDQLQRIGWQIVAQESGRELVFGTVTQPWQANPVFRGLPPDEFARFDEPGYAKIAFTLRVDPRDPTTCIARTETRVQTTDQESRARFRRYWSFLSPGIELIRIVLLQQLKAEAEAQTAPR